MSEERYSLTETRQLLREAYQQGAIDGAQHTYVSTEAVVTALLTRITPQPATSVQEAAVERFLVWAYEREFAIHNWENGRERTVQDILRVYKATHGIAAAPQAEGQG